MKVTIQSGSISEENLRYMAEMAKEKKWDGELIIGSDRNQNERATNRIHINLEGNEETAKDMGFDKDLLNVAVFAHELYHATDTDKHISYESTTKLLEHVYEHGYSVTLADERDELKKQVSQDFFQIEKATDNAVDYLPKSHPQYDELKRTYEEHNSAYENVYRSASRSIVKDIVKHALNLKSEKKDLQQDEDYQYFRQFNQEYEEGVVAKRMENFDEKRFDQNFNQSLASIKIQQRNNVIEDVEARYLDTREEERNELIRLRTNPTEKEKEIKRREWDNVAGLWFPEDGFESHSDRLVPVIHGGNNEAINAFLKQEHGYKTLVNMPNAEEKIVSNEGIMVHSEYSGRAQGYAEMAGKYSKEKQGEPAVLMGLIEEKYLYKNNVNDEYAIPLHHADKIKHVKVIEKSDVLYKHTEHVYQKQYKDYVEKTKEKSKDKDLSFD